MPWAAAAVVVGSYVSSEASKSNAEDARNASAASDAAAAAAAAADAKVAADTLEFNKKVYEEGRPRQAAIDALTTRVTESQLKSQDQANALADDYANYMKGTFRPVEGSLVAEAMKDTESEAELAASDAGAEVDQQFGAARANKARELTSLGINPNSGRWSAATQSSEDAQAAVKADAKNKGRTAGRQLSWAKRMDAASLGRNLPSSQANSASLGITAGNSAVGNVVAGANNARADAGMMNSGFAGAVNANNSSANINFGLSGGARDIFKMQQESDAQLSNGIGQVAGMYLAKKT